MKLNKKVTFFGKQISAVALALMAMIGLASAGLLSYYGMLVGTATVEQSVRLSEDGETWLECTGGDYEQCKITWSYEGPAGATVVKGPYYLKNFAEVPATVKFETSYIPEPEEGKEYGITTKYCSPSGEQVYVIEKGREKYNGPEVDLDDPSDEYSTLGNINLKISYEDGQAVFTITTPEGLIGSTSETYSGSVAFIFDADADGTTDWQVLYEPGSSNFGFEGVWGYEEALESGANPVPRNFVDVTAVSGIEATRYEDSFIVKVDFEKLGGLGSDYKFGFYISVLTEYWGGLPGGADQVMIFFPDFESFDWADTTNYETLTVGTEISEGQSFTIGAGETINFFVKNVFNIALIPDEYTITTEIQPA